MKALTQSQSKPLSPPAWAGAAPAKRFSPRDPLAKARGAGTAFAITRLSAADVTAASIPPLEIAMHNRLLDYQPVMELADAPWPQPAGEDSEDSQDSEESEDSEMALGAQLLEVRDRRALARWLSGLTSGAAQPGTPLGDALLTALTQAAQAVLPLRGPASHLKQRAAAIFGLELEGLSPEDMEFEVARHFVRFATDAAGRLDAGGGRIDRVADAAGQVRAAIGHAARRHAPGLAPAAQLPATPAAGRWRRVGDRIVIDC